MTTASTTGNTCLWCGLVCASVTDHMVHTTLAHPVTPGQRTRRTWTCWHCAATNDPASPVCATCGHTVGNAGPPDPIVPLDGP